MIKCNKSFYFILFLNDRNHTNSQVDDIIRMQTPKSMIVAQPPPIMSQYPVGDSPVQLLLSLPRVVARCADTPPVHFAIRRFDMQELQIFVESGVMMGLRLAQAMFTFKWCTQAKSSTSFSTAGGSETSILTVTVNTKHLPVSCRFGGAPFVFCIWVPITNELLVTRSFTVMAKRIEAPKPRAPPKRRRGPPLAAPITAAAGHAETAINILWQQQLWAKAAESITDFESPLAFFADCE